MPPSLRRDLTRVREVPTSLRERTPVSLDGPVLVVGAGLLGTSIGWRCAAAGVDVALRDVSPENVRIAAGLGAANVDAAAVAPQLVVVAVPPDHWGRWSRRAADHRCGGDRRGQREGRSRWRPPARLVARDALARYVGGHPMAGSERSGPSGRVARRCSTAGPGR